MSDLDLLLLITLALGLVFRVMVSRFEARHLLYAWDYLSQPGRDPRHLEVREVLLDRSTVALSCARLARLLSLLIILPAFVVLFRNHVPTTSMIPPNISPAWSEVFRLLLFAIGIFVLLLLFTTFFMRGFYREERLRSHKRLPAWLTDPQESEPALVAAGALLWEWMVNGLQVITRGMLLHRPIAYLIEQDGELTLAIGKEQAPNHQGVMDRGTIMEEEKTEEEMVRSIERLSETLVREVMRPLNKVTAVSLSGFNMEKFLQLARRTGYTRFPCYYDQVTNLIGYLNVHDFLDSPVPPRDIRKLVHRAVFIPEVARTNVALEEMLRKRTQIAICFDEFGGCSGLLSREDIFEEITGEILDEYDRPDEVPIQKFRHFYLVEASMDLDDLEEALGLELEKNNCDTLAGYIYQKLSRTPRRGESIEEHGWRLEVSRMDQHRVRKVRVYPPRGESGVLAQ